MGTEVLIEDMQPGLIQGTEVWTLSSLGLTRLRVETPDVNTACAPRAPVFNPASYPASERAGARSAPVRSAARRWNRCGPETLSRRASTGLPGGLGGSLAPKHSKSLHNMES